MRKCPQCGGAYPGEEKFCAKDATLLLEERDYARLHTTIASYKLLEVVGTGGHGTVYKARHVYIGKMVAVKILHDLYARHEDAVVRFMREARAASSINHPNICDVSDFGPMPGGGVYFVMEYVEGESLETLIKREAPLALHRSITIVHQIASALAAAHDKNIVHRDVKPDNIMLTRRPGRREVRRAGHPVAGESAQIVIEPEGEYDFVKVLDFGIAKVLEAQGGTLPPGNTAAGIVFGSPSYISPEAARGEVVDLRADIYALGVIFYDLVTGQRPFNGTSAVEVMTKHISEAPVPPRKVAPNAEITEAAERLILKSLAKKREQRQQSMDELIEELEGCFGTITYLRDKRTGPRVALRSPNLTEEVTAWVRDSKRMDVVPEPAAPEPAPLPTPAPAALAAPAPALQAAATPPPPQPVARPVPELFVPRPFTISPGLPAPPRSDPEFEALSARVSEAGSEPDAEAPLLLTKRKPPPT